MLAYQLISAKTHQCTFGGDSWNPDTWEKLLVSELEFVETDGCIAAPRCSMSIGVPRGIMRVVLPAFMAVRFDVGKEYRLQDLCGLLSDLSPCSFFKKSDS